KGEVEIQLAGRPFRISRSFVDDLAGQRLPERVADLRKALLIFHSPTDDVVGIENASRIFTAAKHPKSFVSLAGADHLPRRGSDAASVANVIHAWAGRYPDRAPSEPAAAAEANTVVVRETGRGRFQQEVVVGRHRLLADEPVAAGGLDSGPGPYDLLLAGLCARTAKTPRPHPQRQGAGARRVPGRLSATTEPR